MNYKIWKEEFCLVLLPNKKVPAADVYCVYFYCSGTRGKEDSEQLGFVGDSVLFHQHICSPLTFLLTSQRAISFASPHVVFSIGSREKKKCYFPYECLHFPTPHVYRSRMRLRPQLTKTLADRLNFMQYPWLISSPGCL